MEMIVNIKKGKEVFAQKKTLQESIRDSFTKAVLIEQGKKDGYDARELLNNLQ